MGGSRGDNSRTPLLESLLVLDSAIEAAVGAGRVGVFFIGAAGVFFMHLSVLLASRLNSSAQ